MANQEYKKIVPYQLKMIDKFRRGKQLVNFILEGHKEDATEFNLYPKHCIMGTDEASLIPELIGEQNKDRTEVYYKKFH